MPNIFKSGAFLQQCFSVHPLSLSFKMLTLPDKVGIYCTHCKSRHRLTIGSITRIIGDSESCDEDAALGLESCVSHHPEFLHITDVNIDRDLAQFRCRQCIKGFQTTVTFYETYQP